MAQARTPMFAMPMLAMPMLAMPMYDADVRDASPTDGSENSDADNDGGSEDGGDAGLRPMQVIAIAAGFSFNCALRVDGVALCWGRDGQAQLGAGSRGVPRAEPRPVVGGHEFTSLSAGRDHACGITRSGDLYCWGGNAYGQVGDPAEGLPHPTPFFVRSEVRKVGTGGRHTCLVDELGAVGCFGEDYNWQVSGTADERTGSTIQSVALPAAAADVALGRTHSCARVDGALYCWGSNAGLQLARADTADGPPQNVPGLDGITTFGLGEFHTCAAGATTSCWGTGLYGRLGNDDTADQSSPVGVALTNVAQIDGGEEHSCARRTDGEVWCWGRNNRAQIGASADSSVPVRVPLDAPAVDLAVGGQHNCALLGDGRVFCWGRNDQFQLGTYSVAGQSATPVEVEAFTPDA